MSAGCEHRTWRHVCRPIDTPPPPPDWILLMPCEDRGFPFIGFRTSDWKQNRLVECLAIPVRERGGRATV